MSDAIDNALEQANVIFTAAKEVLNDWDWEEESTLQFPKLLGLLALKMNWTDKQIREYDPIVRFYVRRDSEWYVTRGAYGGIMKTSEKLRKEQAKVSKKQVRENISAKLAEINAKTAEITPELLSSDDDFIFPDM